MKILVIACLALVALAGCNEEPNTPKPEIDKVNFNYFSVNGTRVETTSKRKTSALAGVFVNNTYI